MVLDPVCGMSLDPSTAFASAEIGSARVYFCSQACQRRFLDNPSAFATSPTSAAGASETACAVHTAKTSARVDRRSLLVPAGAGATAAAFLLAFYFGVLTLVSGVDFALEQFDMYQPFIVALAAGFGIQAGLFVYLRRAHGAASGKVVAATGAASGAAMVSCCTHYLVNLLPVLGATGLMTFVAQYQIELFWAGIASNLIGIAYIGRRVFPLALGA